MNRTWASPTYDAEPARTKFSVGQQLARGGYGCVFEATRIGGGDSGGYVLKEIQLTPGDETQQRMINNEVQALRMITEAIDSENKAADTDTADARTRFTALRHAFQNQKTSAYELVLEKAGGGELFARLAQSGAYSERDAADAFKKLVQAVRHMHSLGIVHRDLKPENILLRTADANTDLVICDFGLATIRGFKSYDEGPDGEYSRMVGTVPYMAPEIVIGTPQYSEKSDVFALGCILYAMVHGIPAFYDDEEPDEYGQKLTTREKIQQGMWDFWPDYYPVSQEVQDLITLCLRHSARGRASCDDILAHPWFKTAPTIKHSELADRLRAYNRRRRFRRMVRRLTVAQSLQLQPVGKRLNNAKLSPEIVSLMRPAFFKASNGHMAVDQATFCRVIADAGLGDTMSPVCSTDLFQAFDTNGDGRVDYSEFLAGVALMWSGGADTVKWLFHAYSDAEGGVTEDGFGKLVYTLNPPAFADMESAATQTRLDNAMALFAEFSTEGGVLTYDAFVAGAAKRPDLVSGLYNPVTGACFAAELLKRAAEAADANPQSRIAQHMAKPGRRPPGLMATRHDAWREPPAPKAAADGASAATPATDAPPAAPATATVPGPTVTGVTPVTAPVTATDSVAKADPRASARASAGGSSLSWVSVGIAVSVAAIAVAVVVKMARR